MPNPLQDLILKMDNYYWKKVRFHNCWVKCIEIYTLSGEQLLSCVKGCKFGSVGEIQPTLAKCEEFKYLDFGSFGGKLIKSHADQVFTACNNGAAIMVAQMEVDRDFQRIHGQMDVISKFRRYWQGTVVQHFKWQST